MGRNQESERVLSLLANRIVKAHAASAMIAPAEELSRELATSTQAALEASSSARAQSDELHALLERATTTAAQWTSISARVEGVIADAERSAGQLGGRIIKSHQAASVIVGQNEQASDACRRLGDMIDVAESRIDALAATEQRVQELTAHLVQRANELQASAEAASRGVVHADAAADRLGAVLRRAEDRLARPTRAVPPTARNAAAIEPGHQADRFPEARRMMTDFSQRLCDLRRMAALRDPV